MLRFANLVHHPRKLYRMTGLTLDQFQTLTHRLTPLWEHAERTRLSRRVRQHALGQGTKYKLATMADKLVCVLAFYRFYLTDELLGWLVGLDASNVCRLQQRFEPLIEQAADPSLGLSLRRRLPPGAKKIGTFEKLLEVCPEFAEIVTDATEQPRQRIIVEPVLSRVKKYPVLVQVYRPRITDYHRRFRNIAALTNFRLAPTVA